MIEICIVQDITTYISKYYTISINYIQLKNSLKKPQKYIHLQNITKNVHIFHAAVLN